ncbi:hypothetical protein [Arthrobacter pascens]|uniref:hypothetical protein n=1 Tax=Arthrobacter pascens TaxID=1677 RepID=UPI00196B3E05|nr:hypothetical protein [Arthrobacter pascens]MBN3497864.1 hypothetical protein [Arthrobacter pascens]
MGVDADNVLVRVITLNEAVMATVKRISTLPDPVPDSLIAADDRVCPGVELSSHIGHHLVPSAIDHIWYLTSSISGTRNFPVFGAFTLARSTIETASTMLWVMAPYDRRTRLMRHLRLEVANVNAARKMMQSQNEVGTFMGYSVAPDAPDEFVAGRRAAVMAAAERLELSSAEIERPPTITSIIKEAAQESGESPQVFLDWQIASGAAHGKSWSGLLTLRPKEGWGSEARRKADTDRSGGISMMVDIAERSLVTLGRGLDRLEELRATTETAG